MKAVQYVEPGAAPVVAEVPTPTPGPGQVLLKVTAAGVCHSDIAVMEMPAERLSFPLPLTLGHEGAGIVAEVGDGVQAVRVGDAVAVYGPWGCGLCAKCALGKENYCLRAGELGISPPGLGAPGAIAEYLLVDHERHLVPLGDLDPVETVPLTDAGLTPYHAIKRSLPKLVPGSTAVVIGAGGLGHVAIQLLRALTPARVVALDVSEEKLALAREVGAHEAVVSDADAAAAIRGLTGGLGAEVVLDFVGAAPTVLTAGAAVQVEGDVTIVGLGGGALPVGFGTLPFEATVTAPYWGSRAELIEVLDLARAGAVKVHVETYGIDEAPLAYKRLHEGKVRGRAVILPNG
ncbi:NAD(P)-dependent alcohol dehydrogenase [Yinghuangia seranimata]|uniref:NAD(P)-dependent alcohol dehydrogenase n=1 Tax=Yinghuangia seranimata TaxID=408067 RepID=UPI00248B21E8|nr:NAD(P)-dependent alcohol dehydrogenase [Yinghuangia seranimata]MDI2129556.1 NAD(P)-dependent alcohol dehydrogenase [Yinghuangia seranimata]